MENPQNTGEEARNQFAPTEPELFWQPSFLKNMLEPKLFQTALM
jgi:hypothetical protein